MQLFGSLFFRHRVWVVYSSHQLLQEWLLIGKDPVQFTYVLSNASKAIPLEQRAWLKSQRYLIRRSIQDVNDELSCDEFQARKYGDWNSN